MKKIFALLMMVVFVFAGINDWGNVSPNARPADADRVLTFDQSGTFTNCVGGDYSFGDYGTASGIFLWCRLTAGSFPTPTGAGKQRMCLNADYTEVNADASE